MTIKKAFALVEFIPGHEGQGNVIAGPGVSDRGSEDYKEHFRELKRVLSEERDKKYKDVQWPVGVTPQEPQELDRIYGDRELHLRIDLEADLDIVRNSMRGNGSPSKDALKREVNKRLQQACHWIEQFCHVGGYRSH